LWWGSLFSDPAAAQTAKSPYALSIFAKSAPPSYSQPDSLMIWRKCSRAATTGRVSAAGALFVWGGRKHCARSEFPRTPGRGA
jgi:hypothetical protein